MRWKGWCFEPYDCARGSYTLAYRRRFYSITMKAKARLLAILLLLSVSPTTAALGFYCGRSIINERKSAWFKAR